MSTKSGNCYQINIEKDVSGVKYQIKKNKSRRLSFIRKKSRPMCQYPNCMVSSDLITRKVHGYGNRIDTGLFKCSMDHHLTIWNCK